MKTIDATARIAAGSLLLGGAMFVTRTTPTTSTRRTTPRTA